MLNRLNYHHLYYFWAVAKEGKLTRTARQLHVSQSALSTQIRQLEDALGLTLFDRTGRQLKLTESGQWVFGYAQQIFSLGQEMLASTGSSPGLARPLLRIGSVATLSRNFQENFLRPILNDPQLLLRLESGGLDELLHRLSMHELDLVLSNRPVLSDSHQLWQCRNLARQTVSLVGPALAAGQRFSFPDSLTRQPMILPSQKSDIRLRFDLLCHDLGLVPTIRAEVDDMAMLRLLARDCQAVALVPRVVVQDELKNGQLSEYCVLPQLEERFYAVTVPRKVEPVPLARLIQQMSTAFGRPPDELDPA